MATLTVKKLMSLIEDGDSSWVTLITACSDYEVYSNWYFNLPYEMEDLDVVLIKIESDQLILYVL